MSIQKPDVEKILKGLKDFQRNTVEYVFKRLYGPDPVDRFLIADEVGLGKTLVAKGVVAKAVDYLWNDASRRIDIIYICANRDIAAQNIARLNITNQDDISLSSRLTLLPLHVETLDKRLNFISFTPGTSFDLRSKAGIMRERALLYRMLRDGLGITSSALRNVFQGDAGINSWRYWTERIYNSEYKINNEIQKSFIAAVKKEKIEPAIEALMARFPRCKENVPLQDRRDRNVLIGNVRRLLAQCCLKSLEPDIIILDEFQRFKNLLDGEDDVAKLAHDLFNYHEAKIILLSATPYKMYTMTHESDQDNHYEDFIRTIKFLFHSDKDSEVFESDLEQYRNALYEISTKGIGHLKDAKDKIENKLRKTMVRTERLAISIDHDGMVADAPIANCCMEIQDLNAFKTADHLSRLLEVTDIMEYWKSAPYLFNFMDKTAYNLKKRFIEHLDDEAFNEKALNLLDGELETLLPWNSIRRYKKIDPRNAKLRSLLGNTIGKKAWQLLWVPPSLPYYQVPNSPFDDPDAKSFTKALVFSSWQVVPKVIATLCSYEAERLVMSSVADLPNYPELSKKRRPLIIFSVSEEELRGMRFFALLYPCLTLAAKIDPMKICVDLAENDTLPNLQKVLVSLKNKIKDLLDPVMEFVKQKGLMSKVETQRGDQNWYFAALALLDRYYFEKSILKWRQHEKNPESDINWLAMLPGRDDTESGFSEHVKKFWDYFDLKLPLGSPPDDLNDVLAKVALASPAVVSLRSFMRLYDEEAVKLNNDVLMGASASTALGFRSLFNLPDSITLLRAISHKEDERYWEEVLDYCVNGHLQSVIDEYVHILKESLGQSGKPLESAIRKIANEIETTVSLRTVTLDFDDIRISDNKVVVQNQAPSIRCRFALRFGDAKNADDEEETRMDQVRKAFNSPFRPFILASTSVGQEGLDFHQYCHSIYHWNLPANPVDLEQREGRIHRYKGHVIRKNIAFDVSCSQLSHKVREFDDIWEVIFEKAKAERGTNKNDLVPFWIYERENGYKIQRYVPFLPLSRDQDHFHNLKQTLVAYRMVFGQPRQEDLVEYLKSKLQKDLKMEDLLLYRIDLQPPL